MAAGSGTRWRARTAPGGPRGSPGNPGLGDGVPATFFPAQTVARPRGARLHLTAKERILLHLGDFVRYADVVEVPAEMSQDGISRSAGIRVQHVRQFVGPLLRDGLLRERIAHVRAHRRRLKVYDLTDQGRLAAARLREQLKGEPIRVRDDRGVRSVAIGEFLREAGGKVPFGRILRAAAEGEVLDLAVAPPREPSAFVERLSEMPSVAEFVGRQEELALLTREGEGPRFFVVRGVAGIGKSSLAAMACRQLRGARNLLWHRVRPWDTRGSALAELGEFLASLGRPGLRAVLARGEAGLADRALQQDLPGTKSFLVFDDAHEATAEVVSFLRFLKDTVASAEDVRVVVLTRTALRAYDRRDVAVSGGVLEVELSGLSPKDVRALLSEAPEGRRLLPLTEQLHGHPLFLGLLRSAGRPEVPTVALRDVRRFIEEEIYGSLSDAERKMMMLASLYEVPVPREALFLDERLSHDVLVALQERALIQRVGEDAFGAHDTIRAFFASVPTPIERRLLAGFAVEQLRRLAEREREDGDPLASTHPLSNALWLADEEAERSGLWELLGDAKKEVGDFGGALAAYEAAFPGAEGREGTARLHRKTAMALQERGESESVLKEVELAAQALGGRPSLEQAWLDLVRCITALRSEEFAEAREHGDRALQTFRAFGNASGAASALLELGRYEVDATEGRPDRAQRYLEEAMALAPAVRGEAFRARAHLELARNYAYRVVDIDQAMAHAGAAESLAPQGRDPDVVRAVFNLKGWLLLQFRADYGASRKAFAEVSALGRTIHSPWTVAVARFGLANVDFYEGRVRESLGEFEALSSEMLALGYPQWAIESLWMVAQCCLWLEDRKGVEAALSRMNASELARGREARPFLSAVGTGLERLLSGDAEGSVAALREAVRASEALYATDETSPVHFTEFYLGVVLLATGRDAEAADHLRRSEEQLLRHGLKARLSVPPESAHRLAGFFRGRA